MMVGMSTSPTFSFATVFGRFMLARITIAPGEKELALRYPLKARQIQA
jgi:hypothetical protein